MVTTTVGGGQQQQETTTKRGEKTTVSEILSEVEEEVYRNERMIKLNVALEYMIQLVDPKYRDAFIRAEKSAKTIEDMNKILDLAKKHIGQRTAISILGL